MVLYRSQNGNLNELKQNIDALNIQEKPLLVIGDFNFCYKENTGNPAKKYLREHSFIQLIKDPTHIEGHLIDQAHLRDERRDLDISSEIHSKYYSDHRALALMIKKSQPGEI